MSKRRAIVLFVEDIEGYDGKYGISEDGVVYNWETKKFIFPYLDKCIGYYRVGLYINGKQKLYRLHRLLALTYIPNPNNLKIVDHIDRDTTNNSLSNLRWCNDQQSSRNTSSHKNSSSKYKGVGWYKRDQKWRAYIMLNNKNIHLGYFTDEEEAAKAYDLAAIEHFGEYAIPNFSEEEDITFDSDEEEEN